MPYADGMVCGTAWIWYGHTLSSALLAVCPALLLTFSVWRTPPRQSNASHVQMVTSQAVVQMPTSSLSQHGSKKSVGALQEQTHTHRVSLWACRACRACRADEAYKESVWRGGCQHDRGVFGHGGEGQTACRHTGVTACTRTRTRRRQRPSARERDRGCVLESMRKRESARVCERACYVYCYLSLSLSIYIYIYLYIYILPPFGTRRERLHPRPPARIFLQLKLFPNFDRDLVSRIFCEILHGDNEVARCRNHRLKSKS